MVSRSSYSRGGVIRELCESNYRLMRDRVLGEGNYSVVFEACPTNADIGVNRECRIAVKVIDLGRVPQNLHKEFYRESKMATLAGKLGIGPKVFDSWICSHLNLTLEPLRRKKSKDNFFSGLFDSRDKFLSQYHHSTVTKLEGSGGPYLFIAMEKVSGQTLLAYQVLHQRQYGKKFPMPYRICKALKQTLHKMWNAGLSPHDLHPDQIIVSPNLDKITIIDWYSTKYQKSPIKWDKRLQFLIPLYSKTTLCPYLLAKPPKQKSSYYSSHPKKIIKKQFHSV